MPLAADDIYLSACMEASAWTITDGRIDGIHSLGIRLKPHHATQLELDPVLKFQFDQKAMCLSGALTDGTPIDHSEATELPFGEPGSRSDYECCKSDPMQCVARLLPCAIAEAKRAADAAAGRLRSIVFFRAGGEFEMEMDNLPSQLSPDMAVTAIDNFYTIINWGADTIPCFRLARPEEEAKILAYSAPQGDYQHWTVEALEAAGGVLLARLVEEERAVRSDRY